MRPCLLVLLLTVAACGAAPAPGPAGTPAPLVAAAPASDAVVATVDGRPIRASDVALQARASATSPKEALDQLIDTEVLAGAAAQRGFGARPEVQLATRQAAVRRLLAETFEREVTPASIPRSMVERAYRAHTELFNHGEEVEVCHIVMLADAKAPAAQRAAARSAAAALWERAKGVRTLEEFKALATPPPSGVKDKVEQFVTENPGGLVKPFVDAAFALRHPGDISPVVETRFGYHVIRLVRRIPAVHVPLAKAEPEVRQKLFPSFRAQAFGRWMQALMSAHAITKYPERISAGS